MISLNLALFWEALKHRLKIGTYFTVVNVYSGEQLVNIPRVLFLNRELRRAVPPMYFYRNKQY